MIKKKENILYILVNKEVLFRAKIRKKNITKHIEVKKLRGLERVCIENSWGTELIDQLIKEKNIRVKLKESFMKNTSRRKIIVYTDRSLQREDTQQKIGYSIVQIDEQNNIIYSHRGKLEK